MIEKDSEFIKLKKLILKRSEVTAKLQLLNEQRITPKNAEEIQKAKTKLQLDHKLVEVKILIATKNKFKYIVGHNKAEI